MDYTNKIFHGDCIQGISKLDKHSADIIIADPPYNIGKNFGNNIDNMEMADYVNWCRDWLKQSLRVLKSSGTMFVYGFSEILAHLCVILPNKYGKRWLIWHYTNKNVASLHFWQRSHESILCIWKNEDKRIFNRDKVREPYTDTFLAGSAGKVRPATAGRFSGSGKTTIYNAHPNGALPRDVISIPSLAGGAGLKERIIFCKTHKKLILSDERNKHENCELLIHPTQKPQELTKRLILSCKPKGNFNVLVPFCGSGSECRVVKKLGGNFISFDLNKDYVKLANLVVSITKSEKGLLDD